MANIPRHRRARNENLSKARKKKQPSSSRDSAEPSPPPAEASEEHEEQKITLTWVNETLIPTLVDDEEDQGLDSGDEDAAEAEEVEEKGEAEEDGEDDEEAQEPGLEFDEEQLENYCTALHRAQETLSRAEKAQKLSRKRKKHYTKNSGRSQRRFAAKRREIEQKGVQPFIHTFFHRQNSSYTNQATDFDEDSGGDDSDSEGDDDEQFLDELEQLAYTDHTIDGQVSLNKISQEK